jgi:hypothetical protein
MKEYRTQAEPELLRPTLPLVAILVAFLGVSITWTAYGQLVKDSRSLFDPLMVLLLFLAVRPWLQRFLRLRRGDLLMIYLTATLASCGFDAVDRFLPIYTAPTYFATPENRFEELRAYLPDWFVPKDREVIRGMYEGSEDGRVPWSAWTRPVLLWTGFFLVLWLALLGICSLMRPQWVEKERLAFPIVAVPLYMTDPPFPARDGPFKLFRDPLLWVGFAISSLHYLLFMLRARNPSLPVIPVHLELGTLFTEKPLDALAPFFFYEFSYWVIGLAYFAPQDLCFSIPFFFFLIKGMMLLYRIMGWVQPSGFPFFWEQAFGAFLAMGLFYLWAWRHFLKRRLSQVFRADPGGEEALSPRWALLGAVLGFAVLCGWYLQTGLAAWIAIPFFGLIFLIAVVFTRGRAESGVPTWASVPFWQPARQFRYWLGTKALVPDHNYSNLVHLAGLLFLHFAPFPETMTHQLEGFKIAEQGRLHLRSLTALMTGVVALAIAWTFYLYLRLYYEYGANVLAGGSTAGAYNVAIAVDEFNLVGDVLNQGHTAPEWSRNGFTLGAFLLTAVLVLLRAHFLRFPLHPLGYVLGVAYSYAYWGPFLTAWAAKALIFRLGGVRLYRRLQPAFIGLILGQVFTLSLVHQFLALLFGPEWAVAALPPMYL